jgi:hypothetical protein
MALRAGTENKKQVIMAAVLGVVLLVVLVHFLMDTFGGSSTPPPQTASVAAPSTPTKPEPPSRTSVQGRTSGTAKKVGHINLDPTLHTELLAQAESITYTGRGRNIFSQSSAPIDIPKPQASARPIAMQQQIAQGPPPPPPPPSIDLKFFGYQSKKSGKSVFLLHGDDIFLAGEGDVVNHRYKVVKILPFSVQVEDIPYHNTQNLPLVQN